MTEIKCSAIIYGDGRGGAYCSRKGVVRSADGTHYCKQHLPETVAAKKAASREAWDAEWKTKQKKWDAESREKEARKKFLDTFREKGLHHPLVHELGLAWEKTVAEVESYD